MTLTQKGLVQKITEATGMSNHCNLNWTPAFQRTLGINPAEVEAMNKEWSYPSIVGMLLYLSIYTSCPNISFAVSQVARGINHSRPKCSRASAIKTIVRYLHQPNDKEIIVQPASNLSIYCHVNVNFEVFHGRDPD